MVEPWACTSGADPFSTSSRPAHAIESIGPSASTRRIVAPGSNRSSPTGLKRPSSRCQQMPSSNSTSQRRRQFLRQPGADTERFMIQPCLRGLDAAIAARKGGDVLETCKDGGGTSPAERAAGVYLTNASKTNVAAVGARELIDLEAAIGRGPPRWPPRRQPGFQGAAAHPPPRGPVSVAANGTLGSPVVSCSFLYDNPRATRPGGRLRACGRACVRASARPGECAYVCVSRPARCSRAPR